MALEPNTPKLTLEHMSLGSQERLEAGIREGITRNMVEGYQNYSICLFTGRRPSAEEVENGIYFFNGSRPSDHVCGLFNIKATDYVELATESPFALEGRAPNGLDVMANKFRPVNPDDFVDTDGYAVRHHKFKRNEIFAAASYGAEPSDEIQQLGNGAAPTWALMYPWGHQTSYTTFISHDATGFVPKEFTRRDGKSIKLSAMAVRPESNYFLTVGDIHEEPTANLVLHKGAESGQTEAPRKIRIHRLKYVMPKTKTAPIMLQGA
ncbi:MAG: hypothetical protein GY833_22850 [Aestuariibacter sp.]|nr:hypothetical protein [Aestuariibacter sp.]